MDNLPKRKQIRLKDYDYSQNGYYFITICTHNKQNTLSDICRGGVLLRPFGEIAEKTMHDLKDRYRVQIPSYVIMPNHIHMILIIDRAEQSPAPTVSDIICAYKSLTTKAANKYNNTHGQKLWQRSYYEHIIRNENDYLEILKYITQNPQKRELLYKN